MKNIGAFLFIALLLACANNGIYSDEATSVVRGNTDMISQIRMAEGFNSIVLDGVGNVYIYPGEEHKIVVTTDSNIQGTVITYVNGNVLYIDSNSARNSYTEFQPIRLQIDVYLPELQSINSRGVFNITINSGKASNLEIVTSGVGNINAENYEVESINIEASGVGNTRLWATNVLDGTITGLGNILYKGNPTIRINRENRGGIGTVRPL